MQLQLIEFDQGKPFSAIDTDGNVYDIDYCNRDDCLYAHESGSGGRAYLGQVANTWWAAPGVHPEVYVRTADGEGWEYVPAPINTRVELPDKYKADLWDWASQQETEGCSVCADRLPTDNLCEHIWWDTYWGWWSTPDERERHLEQSLEMMRELLYGSKKEKHGV